MEFTSGLSLLSFYPSSNYSLRHASTGLASINSPSIPEVPKESKPAVTGPSNKKHPIVYIRKQKDRSQLHQAPEESLLTNRIHTIIDCFLIPSCKILVNDRKVKELIKLLIKIMRFNENELLFLSCLLDSIVKNFKATEKYSNEFLASCAHRVKIWLNMPYVPQGVEINNPYEESCKKYPIIDREIDKISPKLINRRYHEFEMAITKYSNNEDLNSTVEKIFQKDTPFKFTDTENLLFEKPLPMTKAEEQKVPKTFAMPQAPRRHPNQGRPSVGSQLGTQNSSAKELTRASSGSAFTRYRPPPK